MITVTVGWTADPVNNPNSTETRQLPIAAQNLSFNAYAIANDTNDANATFSYQWTVLNNRTGQTATLANANTDTATLSGFSDTLGDIRLFCVATNTATNATSESDAEIAPNNAFCRIVLQSANKQLTLPAIGSRNWYTSLDNLITTVDGLATSSGGVASATVNGSGNLILTLDDGSTIDAGHVVGATGAAGSDGVDGVDGANGSDGVDGADGADGAAGPSQRRYAFTATLHHHWDGSSLQTHFQPTKDEILCAWRAPVDFDLKYLAVTAQNGGSTSNNIDFTAYKATSANWTSGSLTSIASSTVLLSNSGSAADPISNEKYFSSSVTAGEVFGVVMSPNGTNSAMKGLTITLWSEET